MYPVSSRETGLSKGQKAEDPVIRPLMWSDVKRFIALRHEIEEEARHLGPDKGERKSKETDLYTLLRMVAHRRRMFTFVALDGNALVGYMSIILAKFKKFSGNAYITLSVRASHRGRGIGTRLLEAAEAFGRERGIRRLELEVFAKNENAVRLYERRGYEIEGRRKKAVEDGGEFDDVLLMAKFIDSQ